MESSAVKKSIMIMLISFAAVFLLSAADPTGWYVPVVSNNDGVKIDIKASMSPIIEMSVDALYSSDFADDSGMPFYLTGPDVQYKDGWDGIRQIAKWTLHSNTENVLVKISAENLIHESSTVSVPYVLGLSAGNNSVIEVNSGSASYSGYPFVSSDGADQEVNISEAAIYFKLANSEVNILSEAYPVGDYNANVTITVTPGGDV